MLAVHGADNVADEELIADFDGRSTGLVAFHHDDAKLRTVRVTALLGNNPQNRIQQDAVVGGVVRGTERHAKVRQLRLQLLGVELDIDFVQLRY